MRGGMNRQAYQRTDSNKEYQEDMDIRNSGYMNTRKQGNNNYRTNTGGSGYNSNFNTLQKGSGENDEEEEIREMREKIKRKYPYMSSNDEGEDMPEQQHERSFKTLQSHMVRQTSRKSYDVSDNEQKKINMVERSLKDLEQKSHEMSRYIESLRHERSRIDDSKFGEFENEKLKQEYATLKSDNIIFREDINRLTDLNRHLEEELNRQRNRK
jgi:hypothetical protein